MKRVLEIFGWGLYLVSKDEDKKELATTLLIGLGAVTIAVVSYFVYVLGGWAKHTDIFGNSVLSSAHIANLPLVAISPFAAYVVIGLMIALSPRKKV